MKKRHGEEVDKEKGDLLKHRASLVSLTLNLKNKKWLAAGDCKVFWPGELKAGWWKDSQDLTVVTKSVGRFCRKTPEKMKFWQVSTVGPFEDGNWKADIAKKGLLMEDVGLLGAVLFGAIWLTRHGWKNRTLS